MEFEAAPRAPDPERLLKAYGQSASTLNLLRAFAGGGYADLHNIHRWTLGFVDGSPQGARYRELADKISESLAFMDAIGVTPESHPDLHAGRVLHQPRGPAARLRGGADPRRFHRRATGTTSPPTCCGSASAPASSTARTSSSCRGVKNPIGLKVGPTLEPDDLLRLIDALNPDDEPGAPDALRPLRLRQDRRPPAAR